MAQLLIRWAPRADNDPFYLSPPPGVRRWWRESVTNAAAIAMGTAVGADPWELTESDELVEASVKNFMAERQDG